MVCSVMQQSNPLVFGSRQVGVAISAGCVHGFFSLVILLIASESLREARRLHHGRYWLCTSTDHSVCDVEDEPLGGIVY